MLTVHRFSTFFQQTIQTVRQKTDYFLNKLEVVTDNAIVVNSIRLLIILLALLMAYNTPSKNKNEISQSKKIEVAKKSMGIGLAVQAFRVQFTKPDQISVSF